MDPGRGEADGCLCASSSTLRAPLLLLSWSVGDAEFSTTIAEELKYESENSPSETASETADLLKKAGWQVSSELTSARFHHLRHRPLRLLAHQLIICRVLFVARTLRLRTRLDLTSSSSPRRSTTRCTSTVGAHRLIPFPVHELADQAPVSSLHVASPPLSESRTSLTLSLLPSRTRRRPRRRRMRTCPRDPRPR